MTAKAETLRKRARDAEADVADLRKQFQKDPSKSVGRRLFNARQRASEVLRDLYEVCPEDRPPTREVEL